MKILEIKANEIRQSIIEMLAEAGSGHSAGALGMADVFTAFYFEILSHNPKNPNWHDRDRLILSNGHICPVQYATLAHAGYFPLEELKTLREFGTRLQGHPERWRLPGLETTSGPLGSGLSQAAGYALAARMDGENFHVYCLMSDGEQEAGNTWEAAMFAAKNRLDNLTAVIDRNFIQIEGSTEDVMPLMPLKDKYKSFGWEVLEIDGHNFEEILDAVKRAKKTRGRPTVIIANVTPGKGVSFMENDHRWHGVPPGKGPEDRVKRDRQKEVALEELKEAQKELVD